MNHQRALLLGFVVGLLGAFAGCGEQRCSPASCPDGCCDSAGACQVNTTNACGVSGEACQRCALGFACLLGTCAPATGTDGGAQGGGAQGGGAQGGGAQGGGAQGGGGGAVDAGGEDAGTEDAGTEDAGAADAGTPDAGTPDAGGEVDAGDADAGVEPCPSFATSPPDGDRRVVVSHPYTAAGTNDDLWEVFTLSSAGVLSAANQTFRMERTTSGSLVFTPDGLLGFAATASGRIGSFRFTAQGVDVLTYSSGIGFSASSLMLHPAGNKLWVFDSNTQGNGGGVYEFDIACDGRLGSPRRVPGNNAAAGVALPNAQLAVVAARNLASSALQQDVVVMSTATPPAVLSSTTGFPDSDAVAAMLAVSRDELVVAMPDIGLFGGDRIAFFERSGTSLVSRQVVAVPDALAVVLSPVTDVGLVVTSATTSTYRRLTWDAARTSFTISTPLQYQFGDPELPGRPVMVTRGTLAGRVLVPEVDAIRQLQFEADGGISDLARTPASGTGSAQLIGAIGVTP